MKRPSAAASIALSAALAPLTALGWSHCTHRTRRRAAGSAAAAVRPAAAFRRRLTTTHLAGSAGKEADRATRLEEPDNTFGRMAYWDESYRESQVDGNADGGAEGGSTETFSWYCGWSEELEPFFSEVVPVDSQPLVLVPGVGNDACVRDMFDAGYTRLTAFDYAPGGVECARRMFGPDRLALMEDVRVADARSLPRELYRDGAYDAVFDKGTLDSVYLSGGQDKELARAHLSMAVEELARVVRVGGIAFSVTAACVDAVQASFDGCNEERVAGGAGPCWRQLRDGGLWMTEDGYASNNVDATMLVWERI